MERIIKEIAVRLDRRSFFGKIGFGLAGALLGLLGFSRRAEALYDWACCTLCQPRTSSCSGCTCSWCWSCGPWVDGFYYACCECYSMPNTCDGGCDSVYCSWSIKIQRPGPL